jgi:hypothetical protein
MLVVLAAAAVVIVQVLPFPPPDEYGERLITACTQGLRQGACVLANEATVDKGSTVVAEIRWEDESFRVAVIRLGRPQAGEHEWTSGKVVFDDEDSLLDRWTTAGFTVATLAGDLAGPAERGARPPPTEPAAIVEPASPRPDAEHADAPSQAKRRASVRMAAGASAGQAMHDQALRRGLWASIAYLPWDLPLGLRLRGATTWAAGSGTEVRWSTVTAGLESHFPVEERVALVVAADGGPSLLTASFERTEQRIVAAFSLFFGCDVAIAGGFSLIGGGEVSAGPTTTLTTGSGRVADRRFKLGGIVGLAAKL